jgi:hypothetical protein
MTEPNQPKVVELVDAGVPADQGLSSLGMLMQLAGNLFAAYMSLTTFAMLVLSSRTGSGNETLWVLLLLGAAITRSLVHRSAGAQLLYGVGGTGQGNRMAGIQRYLVVAFGQSALTGLLLLWKFGLDAKMAFGITAGLAAWPATLAGLLALPRFKRFKDDLPLTEDKGFEGASILMTVLGLCGLVGGGTALLYMLDLPGSALTKGPGVLVILSLAMLVVRSVIHVQAGLSGLRTTSVDRSVELANRYANFGIISSFCAGGAIMLFIMSIAFDLTGLAVICGLVWMLMAWPLIVRRFFADRQFADLLAGAEAPVHRRAPDAGLTWLGWLLLAHAVFTASFLIPTVLMGSMGHMGRHGGGGDALSGMLALGGAVGLRSIWWSVGLVILQAWGGYELVRMSPQSRIIATVYGAIGVAVTVYMNWPLIQMIRHSHGPGMSETLAMGPLVLALIIPIATILLVNRKIAPTATARFKPKAPEPEAPPA